MSRAATSLIIMVSLLGCTLAGCGARLFPAALPTASPDANGQTPSPTTPSFTPTPVSSPTAVAAPERPAQFERYASIIVAYLNDTKGDQDALRAMLNDWAVLRQAADLLRIDVDDDGVGELLLVIVNYSPEYGNAEGDLLVLDFRGEAYQVGYSAAGGSVLPDPALIEVGDLNRDGYTEIAYSSTSCGAHTCFTRVFVVSSGTGTYADLTAGGIEMAYVEPYFADWDNDGVPELIMQGGIIGSVGAGPQRERVEVYRWDGATYVLTETVVDPYTNYLYFRVVDANQALLDGDYERAATLYREAIDNPDLDVWIDEAEREELAAFSRYRLTLTYLMMGEVRRAEAAREELQAAQPGNVYAQVATVLWDAYQQAGDPEAACQAVNDFAQSRPEVAQVLADYGYSNPTFTAAEVCPLELF